jgi:AsmA protein
VTLNGTISVPAREYDLKGVASLVSNGISSFDLPFVVQGPWDDPLIFPEADALIKRSTVTAPLLDALKDRNTRDAVRSVLERLTGGKKNGSPDPAAASAPAEETPAK